MKRTVALFLIAVILATVVPYSPARAQEGEQKIGCAPIHCLPDGCREKHPPFIADWCVGRADKIQIRGQQVVPVEGTSNCWHEELKADEIRAVYSGPLSPWSATPPEGTWECIYGLTWIVCR